jgi:hypothetical protein
MKNGADGDQYFLNLALIREAALAAGRPFLNIIQANTIEKSWRLPDPPETRFLGLHDDGIRRARHQLLHLLGSRVIRRPVSGRDALADGRRGRRDQRRDRKASARR